MVSIIKRMFITSFSDNPMRHSFKPRLTALRPLLSLYLSIGEARLRSPGDKEKTNRSHLQQSEERTITGRTSPYFCHYVRHDL